MTSDVAQNKTNDFVRDSQKRYRRVRKIRNKLCSSKCSRLNAARLNESDILEFKRKENMNNTISNEKIGKEKSTKPLFKVHYGKSL